MAKRGYTCQCGWRLNRTGTRRGYAEDKRVHALKCEALAEELEKSKRVPVK